MAAYARSKGLDVYANGPQICKTEPCAHTMNKTVWAPYLALTSFTTLFEWDLSAWESYTAHASFAYDLGVKPAKLGGYVLNAPNDTKLEPVLRLAVERDLGWLSVNAACHHSATAGCTYAELPPFWDALVAAVEKVNSGKIGATERLGDSEQVT